MKAIRIHEPTGIRSGTSRRPHPRPDRSPGLTLGRGLVMAYSTGSTSNAGCLGAIARI
jgi:hypothetical protein